tara:strand:- start:45 stop:167 length:123 start_codon:yes stop_codon:yes gene_type:complete
MNNKTDKDKIISGIAGPEIKKRGIEEIKKAKRLSKLKFFF